MDWLAGLVVMAGAVLTVRATAFVVVDPAPLVKTARYRFPSWLSVVAKLRVVEVAPEKLLKLAPPSVLTCHWTVGAGVPLAAALKVAVPPAQSVAALGWR